jgi:hypothetical protein
MHDENEVFFLKIFMLYYIIFLKIEGSSDVLIAYCTPGGGN